MFALSSLKLEKGHTQWMKVSSMEGSANLLLSSSRIFVNIALIEKEAIQLWNLLV